MLTKIFYTPINILGVFKAVFYRSDRHIQTPVQVLTTNTEGLFMKHSAKHKTFVPCGDRAGL